MAGSRNSHRERAIHKHDHGHDRDPAELEEAWLSATEADTPGGLLHAGDVGGEAGPGHQTQPRHPETINPVLASPSGNSQRAGNAGRLAGAALGERAQSARRTGERHKKAPAAGEPADRDTGDPGVA
jgi:hypothetical protein